MLQQNKETLFAVKNSFFGCSDIRSANLHDSNVLFVGKMQDILLILPRKACVWHVL